MSPKTALRSASIFVPVLWLTLTSSASGQTITEIINASGDGNSALDFPYDVAADSAGNAYVTGGNSDNAFMITAAGDITEIITASGDNMGNTLDEPQGIAVDDAGNVYVVGRLSGNVFKIAPGVDITAIATGLNDPRQVAVDAAGNVYVTLFTANSAIKITPGGTISTLIDATGDGSNTLQTPSGIAVDSDSNVYVAGWINIFKIPPGDPPAPIEFIDSSSGYLGASWITVDAAGTVYAAATPNNAIYEITEGNATQIGPPGPPNVLNPTGIALDAYGNVYVGGGPVGNMIQISPDNVTTEILSTEVTSTQGLASDGFNTIFTVGRNSNNVVKYDVPAPPQDMIRGDANGDGDTDVSDAVSVLSFLFMSGTVDCVDALDINDSESVTVSDAFQLLCWLFCSPNAPPPAAPFPDCGGDPGGTDLDCFSVTLCP